MVTMKLMEVSKDVIGKTKNLIKVDGFYINSSKKQILIENTISTDGAKNYYLKLTELSYKIGRYAKENNIKLKVINNKSNSIVLGLLQSVIDVETFIDTNAIKNIYRNPDEYIPDYLDIEVDNSFKWLNKFITDLKTFINIPHNLLPYKDLVENITDYLDYTIDKLLVRRSTEKRILTHHDLKKKGYNLITAVAEATGSEQNANIIHYTYKPNGVARSKIVLIGKGVHFDTGGYSLKPSDGMITMKRDKAGAITSMMIFLTAIVNKLPIEIDLVLGMTENMLDNYGYKPGDILKAKNGKTVEVINTDAEGRLVLADCLNYVNENINDEIDTLITTATLTGASVRAVSKYTIAEHGNYYLGFSDYIAPTGDFITNLKAHPKLKETIKSEIADIRNVATISDAGSITAYLFLKEFLPDNVISYTHFDIAGPSYTDSLYGFTKFGATGCLLPSMHLSLISEFGNH